MYGYKGFNKDFCCLGFQYEVGKTYELEGDLEICKNGFHFCTDPQEVLKYYPSWMPVVRGRYRTGNRYALIEAVGDIVNVDLSWSSKHATNKILIIKEVGFDQYLRICNEYCEKHGKNMTEIMEDMVNEAICSLRK